MKKQLVIMVVLLLCISVVIGCGTPAPAPKPATPAPAAPAPAAPTPAAPAAPAPAAPAPKPTTPAPAPAPTTPPYYGGILKFAVAGAPTSPIGWKPETWGPTCCTAMFLCLQFLLKERTNGDLEPFVAESWDVNYDPKNTYITFKLKKGVKFADGSDFNAQAVKWNLEQLKAGPADRGSTANWEKFEVLDDYTIRVYYNKWQNNFLRGWADCGTYLCSPTAFYKNGVEWMKWHMVGTGAYIQTDYQKDVVTRVRRQDNYWDKGKPYLEGIDQIYVPDELTRKAILLSGEADIMDGVTPRVAKELADKGYQIFKKQGGPSVLVPDSANTDSAWSNLKVRQAAEYAIDKEAIVKAFGYGYWETAYQLPTPDGKAFDPNFAGKRTYDPEKAKALLKEAGFPNGFKTTLICDSTGGRDIPVAIKSYLDAVGINTEIDMREGGAYRVQMTSPWKNALFYNSFISWPNFNNSVSFYLGPLSAFFKSTKKPDGWVAMYDASINAPTENVALMRKMARELYDDVTVINVMNGRGLYAAKKKVQDIGLEERSSCYWNVEGAWISK